MTRGALLLALVIAAPATARAGRPDDGGDLFNFEEGEVLDAVDGPAGIVRVHYSVDGANETILRDDDGSGFPDYPEEIAATAEDVLTTYATAGFRPPVSEADAGLGALGGSGAFDFYLLDYGGSADGQFAVDGCADGVCAGHMLMENDFRGYGYPSLSEAIRVLTSHELFHAVQSAYTAEMPVWVSEGTAEWAERFYDPTVRDFLGFASAYLEDTGRSLDRPPLGPVPAFAYGTCLFWEFMTERLGTEAMLGLMEHSADVEGLDALDLVLADEKASLRDEWVAFGAANLATGPRAGGASYYPFSADVDGLVATASGTSIHDDNRFYPLATTYYFLEHDGGALWFAALDDPAGLVFSLHAVDGAGQDAPLGDTLLEWSPVSGDAVELLDDVPRGDYWLRGTQPTRADQSVKVDFCVGTEDAVAPCIPPAPDGGVDAGGEGELDAAAPDAGADAGVDAGGGGGEGDDDDDGGCSCRAGAAPGRARRGITVSWMLALALAWALSRARR